MTAVAARLALAFVLLLAAAGKTRAGVSSVGEIVARYGIVPAARARTIARLLIGLEAAAGLLLVTPWHTLGAALAAFLALGFACAVSSALARGEAFSCGCFGPVVRLRVSAWLFGLDLVLLGLALYVLGEPLAGGWGLPWQRLAVVLLAVLVIGGSLQAARVAFLPARAGSSSGAPAPHLIVRSVAGTTLPIDGLATEGIVLVFVTAPCPRCLRLLRSLTLTRRADVPLLFVGSGSPHAVRTLLDEHGGASEWTTSGSDAVALRRAFRIPGSPAAVGLAGGRVLATAFPATVEAVHEIARQVHR